tara:strand:- start:76 stop:933 length:858 start_codon:yes stop_codon:yes gene_type:complete
MNNRFTKYSLFLLFFTLITSLCAQEVSGVYHVRGNSPEGGTNYVLFPDNTFVVGYFGGMITGTWKKNGDLISFKNRVEPQFVLYGRRSTIVKDTVNVRFNVRENQGVAVGFTRQEPAYLKYVFNKNANCFSYPYIHKQTEKVTDLYVATIPYNSACKTSASAVFHFQNPENFNEFILINLPDEYTEDINFSARIENDLLYFDTNLEGSTKRPLESLSEEDSFYLKNYTQNSILPAMLEYGHEFFPYVEDPTVQYLIPFNRIEPTILKYLKIELVKGSFFYTTCEE